MKLLLFLLSTRLMYLASILIAVRWATHHWLQYCLHLFPVLLQLDDLGCSCREALLKGPLASVSLLPWGAGDGSLDQFQRACMARMQAMRGYIEASRHVLYTLTQGFL